MILDALKSYKTKKLLLKEDLEIESLDNAMHNLDGEKLFTNILDTTIIAKNSVGNWIKNSDKSYSFFISSKEKVKFVLEDNYFVCISQKSICEKLY